MNILAVIVNYKAAEYCISAVKSIVQSRSFLHAKEAFHIEIVVIDNSTDKKQAAVLARNLDNDAHLIINKENTGFSSACNQAFDMFDSDLVLLLNPDACLLPGALIQMVATIASDPDIAAVAPRIFWDDECEYLLPPSMPLWFSSFVSGLAGDSFMLRSIASLLWQKYAVKYWQADHLFPVSNMSGGAVLLKRNAVLKSGGLFDEDFFLYFEDTDLFLRLKKNRYTLLMDPTAGVVHYYNQCGGENTLFKRKQMEASEKIFYGKHMGPVVSIIRNTAGLVNYCSMRFSSQLKILKNSLFSGYCFHRNEHSFCRNLHSYHRNVHSKNKIDFTAPFVINLPFGHDEKWLFEWSPDPFFLTAAAKFGKGNKLRLTEDKWKMFSSGVYYGRITYLAEYGINRSYDPDFFHSFFTWEK